MRKSGHESRVSASDLQITNLRDPKWTTWTENLSYPCRSPQFSLRYIDRTSQKVPASNLA